MAPIMSGSPPSDGRCEDRSMSDYSQILVDQVDAVLTITLNRPEKLNAYTPTMMGELISAVTAANDDDSVGAIVVTGAGRGFCAGADIEAVFGKGLQDDKAAQAPPRETRGTDWVQLVRDSKPMIAAINGASIGVGLTLVLPFDQILAA
jgi:2-(1,2-epoxy-1,2-dihydrophenyl)acetyl-CoA isomerase